MNYIKKIKSVGVPIVILLTIIFFSKTFFQYFHQVQNNIIVISPINIVVSFCFFVGYLLFRALSWKSLVYFLGSTIDKRTSLSVWFFSEATRYIPGNIWSFASRAYLAQKEKVSRNASFLVLPIEIATVIAVTSLFSSFAILTNLEKLPLSLTFFIVLAGSLLVLLILFLLQKQVKKIIAKFFEQELNLVGLFSAFFLQCLSWAFYAAGTLVLINNLGTSQHILLLFSSAILAWLLGYLSVITPMGLGVRETVFVLLVGPLVGPANAILIAIFSRILLIFAELSILGFLVISKKRAS